MIDWIGFAAEEANAMRDVDVGQDGGRVENLDQERRTLFIKPTGRSVREAAQRMFKQMAAGRKCYQYAKKSSLGITLARKSGRLQR